MIRTAAAALMLMLMLTAAAAPARDPAVDRTLASLPAYAPGPAVNGVVRLWGHGSFKRDFVGVLVRRWIAEFGRRHPGVRFEYRMYGTASAIGAVAVGAGDIALLGEEISPDAAQLFQRAKGYAPTGIEVATGSVDVNFFDYAHMVFVHRDNPLAKLSLRQIEAVFGAEHRCTTGNIRTWGQLGLTGDWADKPIVPYGWESDVDFGLFIRERALCDSHRWNPALKEYAHATRPDGSQYDHGQRILDALGRDRYGIAISNVRYQTRDVRPLALSWQAGGRAVRASVATLIDRSYPLVRIIPAYIDRAPGKPAPPAAAAFLRYILSREGQTALVEESGYLPLSRAALLRERAKLR